jgi:hypothetical protein
LLALQGRRPTPIGVFYDNLPLTSEAAALWPVRPLGRFLPIGKEALVADQFEKLGYHLRVEMVP